MWNMNKFFLLLVYAFKVEAHLAYSIYNEENEHSFNGRTKKFSAKVLRLWSSICLLQSCCCHLYQGSISQMYNSKNRNILHVDRSTLSLLCFLSMGTSEDSTMNDWSIPALERKLIIPQEWSHFRGLICILLSWSVFFYHCYV